MGKKRSILLVLFAIVIILDGLGRMFPAVIASDVLFNPARVDLDKLIPSINHFNHSAKLLVTQFRILGPFIIGLCSIIAGIGIILFKNNSRKFIISVAILDIIYTTIFVVVIKEPVFIGYIYSLAIIIIFSLPKVKEQFK